MIQILNAEPIGYSGAARSVLLRLGKLVECELDRAALLRMMPEVDVLLVRLGHDIDREVLDAGLRLKAIVTATTGLDHIDTATAERRGVAVLSLSGEHEFLQSIHATAEHTWALLLALVRRIPSAAESVRDGYWNRDGFRGVELSGRRLGLLGFGRIGKIVARYGRAFGMSVVAYDVNVGDWPSEVEHASSATDLFAQSDVISLHLPLTPESRGLVNARLLAALPDGAYLVNTSRGAIIDESALLHALKSGKLAGAALDVIHGERGAQSRPILAEARQLSSLLITPHIGGATVESMARTELFMAHKLADYLRTSATRALPQLTEDPEW